MRRQATLAPVVSLTVATLANAAPFLFALAGLTLSVIGTFVWAGPGPGLIAAGIACFVLEWRVMSGAEPAEQLDVRAVGQRGTPGPFTPDGP